MSSSSIRPRYTFRLAPHLAPCSSICTRFLFLCFRGLCMHMAAAHCGSLPRAAGACAQTSAEDDPRRRRCVLCPVFARTCCVCVSEESASANCRRTRRARALARALRLMRSRIVLTRRNRFSTAPTTKRTTKRSGCARRSELGDASQRRTMRERRALNGTKIRVKEKHERRARGSTQGGELPRLCAAGSRLLGEGTEKRRRICRRSAAYIPEVCACAG